MALLLLPITTHFLFSILSVRFPKRLNIRVTWFLTVNFYFGMRFGA
jgi:hypothetical protein